MNVFPVSTRTVHTPSSIQRHVLEGRVRKGDGEQTVPHDGTKHVGEGCGGLGDLVHGSRSDVRSDLVLRAIGKYDRLED